MKQIPVTASKSYEVLIGSGLLPKLGDYAAKFQGVQKIMVVSETNVWPLHGQKAVTSLEQAGFQVFRFVFPAGEASKNAAVYLELLNALAESKLSRSDLIVALGGGVVGDLAGFAAATYLRGIRLIQVPTTLLSAVDSSVGGKTAIDLPSGKNLVGAFYQPNLVLCDIDCLCTLPDDIFLDGCAEVIKYGILYDPGLFDLLHSTGPSFPREDVIARCVELKRDVVAQDEFDTGLRMKLNLGHTVGHAVEAESHFSISHGKAVAIGTAIVARACCNLGICGEAVKNRIIETLEIFGLPTRCDFSPQILAAAALSDKKRSGGTVSLIVPTEIGNCAIRPTPVEELESFIEAGLTL